ncbi:peptidase [Alloprevotella tannerae]|uniref:peptidase n=1 Tax=Alloprevotella tannerae TaxID=76122 RepID=UPI0028E33140|nr:peptidase [Alloprevotella tannerae]
MRNNLLQKVCAAIVVLFIATCAMPTTAQAQTEYELWVCGTQVTSANCSNLSSVVEGVSGKVSYNPDTKVLMLQDANIKTEGKLLFKSNIDGLTMQVVGTNSLETDKAVFWFTAPLTIMGGGILNMLSTDNCTLYARGTNLTIEDCTINAEGKEFGIAGNNGTNETLTIKNASITVEGKKYGTIVDFAELNLIGCAITQPAGAAFDKEVHAVAIDGSPVKSKVVITKDATGIAMPTLDPAAKQGVYSLSGVKLNSEVNNLPKGIYVINGKKVVKK